MHPPILAGADLVMLMLMLQQMGPYPMGGPNVMPPPHYGGSYAYHYPHQTYYGAHMPVRPLSPSNKRVDHNTHTSHLSPANKRVHDHILPLPLPSLPSS
jgi:hypothetical protein